MADFVQVERRMVITSGAAATGRFWARPSGSCAPLTSRAGGAEIAIQRDCAGPDPAARSRGARGQEVRNSSSSCIWSAKTPVKIDRATAINCDTSGLVSE